MFDRVLGGVGVGARLETKVDTMIDQLGHLRADVVHLKARDGEHERLQTTFMRDNWPRVEETVVRTSENLARLTQTVMDLAESVKTLEGRVERGEAGIADLRRLQDAVQQLRETDGNVVRDIETLKKTTTRWGGGLAVLLIVGGLVMGMVKFRIVSEDPPAPAPQMYYAAPPPAVPTEPARRRGR